MWKGGDGTSSQQVCDEDHFVHTGQACAERVDRVAGDASVRGIVAGEEAAWTFAAAPHQDNEACGRCAVAAEHPTEGVQHGVVCGCVVQAVVCKDVRCGLHTMALEESARDGDEL